MLSTTYAASRKPAWGPWLLLAAFYLYFIGKTYGYQLDDALIYLRYIDNALAGHGLVYNDGVRFNGLTSPLFSYLVLALGWLLGDAQLASFVVSSAALFLAAVATARLFERSIAASAIAMPPLVAWFGAALVLFLPYFYLTFGMETGLFTLLSALLIEAMRDRRYGWAGVCAALVFLTRSEGVFLIVAVAVADLARTRRLPPFTFATYVAPVLIVAAVFALNYFYYGAALPQTGMAKIWQGESGLWGDRLAYLNVGYLYGLVFGSDPLLVGVYAVFLGIGLIVLRDSYLVGTVILYLCLYTLFYVVLNIPNYHWYYSPFFMFAPYFAAAGFGGVLTAMRRFERGPRGTVLLAAIAIPMLLALMTCFQLNSVARSGVDAYRRIGLWMQANLDANASVAMVEIGTVGYYSHRNIVDILGLVNPDNARFIGERRLDAWLQEYDVTQLLVHDPLWDHEVSLFGAGLSRIVTEDCRFAFPGYKLFQVSKGDAAGIRTCDREQTYAVSAAAAADTAAKQDEDRGHVDEARVVGNFLRVQGWARDAANLPFETLGYRGPGDGRPIWRKTLRDDVSAHFDAPALQHSGFSGAIRFDTHAQAKAALERGCLLARGSREEPPASLPLKPGTTCE